MGHRKQKVKSIKFTGDIFSLINCQDWKTVQNRLFFLPGTEPDSIYQPLLQLGVASDKVLTSAMWPRLAQEILPYITFYALSLAMLEATYCSWQRQRGAEPGSLHGSIEESHLPNRPTHLNVHMNFSKNILKLLLCLAPENFFPKSSCPKQFIFYWGIIQV